MISGGLRTALTHRRTRIFLLPKKRDLSLAVQQLEERAKGSKKYTLSTIYKWMLTVCRNQQRDS